MGMLNFLKNFVTRPGTTGALAPSSRALAELITEAAGVRDAGLVVEFGTGTGVFTEAILQKLSREASYFGIEINPDFVRQTQARCPAARIYEDSAVNAGHYLEKSGLAHCDCIVSGLPWAVFPGTLQDELLTTICRVLKPGGVFVTFAYLQGVFLPAGKRFRRKLSAHFPVVTATRTVWRNFPPAFVYRAVR